MYVISYDISSNRLRNKIFKTLKNYGRHIQFSVFECELSNRQYNALYKELMGLMQGQPEGSIRIYDLCEICSKNIRAIGVVDNQKAEKEDIVVI